MAHPAEQLPPTTPFEAVFDVEALRADPESNPVRVHTAWAAVDQFFRPGLQRLAQHAARSQAVDEVDEVDGIVDLALMQALRRGIPFDTLGAAWRWLTTTVTNAARDQLRSGRRRAALHETMGEDPALVASPPADALAVVISEQTVGVIERALAMLSAKDRELLQKLVQAQDGDGPAYERLEAELGLNGAQLRKRVSRARRRLLAHLRALGYTPEQETE